MNQHKNRVGVGTRYLRTMPVGIFNSSVVIIND